MDTRKMLLRIFAPIVVYGAFFLRAFSFIILLPFLTRIVDVKVWGGVLSAQSLVIWLSILMDFGFTLSLSRKIAINRENILQIRRDVGNVYSAKLLLLLPAMLITLCAIQLGTLKLFPTLSWWAFIIAALQGLSPLWYYQATEKMYLFSLIDIIGRIIYIILAVLFIHETNQAYLVLALQAISLVFVNLITISVLWKEINGFYLSFSGAIRALKEGAILSGFSILTSIYTSASTFLFGLFVSPIVVPQYGNADRLLRSGISLLGPLNQLLLPRSARAFAQGLSQGISVAKNFLLIYFAIGILGWLIGWILAPYAVQIFFGDKYQFSLIYLRKLLILFPITAINTVLVYHILIPLNLEKVITKIYSIVSILACVFIYLLVPRLGALGMVYAMLLPEFLAFLIMIIYIMRINSKIIKMS